MKRHFGIVGIALLGAGCQVPSANLVSIDLQKVPVLKSRKPLEPNLDPVRLAKLESRRVVIDAVTERVVGVERVETAAKIRELIRRDAADAIAVLARELLDILKPELDDYAEALGQGLIADKSLRWRQFSEDIRPIFEKYASDREPLLVELLLLDRPIPRGVEIVEPESEDPGIRRRAEKMTIVKEKIAKLDRDYEDAIRKLESRRGLDLDALTASKAEKIRQKSAELAKRAQDEAQSLIRTRDDSFAKRQQGDGTKRLPAVAGGKAILDAVPAQTRFERVPSSLSPRVTDLDTQRQLRIWLKLNNYELAPIAAGVEDKTNEFIAWRAKISTP